MPCIGPNYDKNIVDEVYEKVMTILKNDYHIQNDKPSVHENHFNELRKERNKNLKNAIRLIVELDSWEIF